MRIALASAKSINGDLAFNLRQVEARTCAGQLPPART